MNISQNISDIFSPLSLFPTQHHRRNKTRAHHYCIYHHTKEHKILKAFILIIEIEISIDFPLFCLNDPTSFLVCRRPFHLIDFSVYVAALVVQNEHQYSCCLHPSCLNLSDFRRIHHDSHCNPYQYWPFF